jgi:hypothetical protein
LNGTELSPCDCSDPRLLEEAGDLLLGIILSFALRFVLKMGDRATE